jgi:hypothetical protein
VKGPSQVLTFELCDYRSVLQVRVATLGMRTLVQTVACYFLNFLALATFAGLATAGHFSTVIQLPDHLIVGAQGPQSFSMPLALPLQRTWSTQGGFLTVGIE